MHACVLDLEMQPGAGRNARGDQILHHLLLPVDRDRAPSRELVEGDAMIRALEAQRDAAMDEPFAVQARTESGLAHEVDGALLEHTRAHALLNVLSAAALHHHALDAGSREQMREHEPRRSRANDADLRLLSPHALLPSLRCNACDATSSRTMRNAVFAVGTPQ